MVRGGVVEIAIQHSAPPRAVLVYRDHTFEYNYNAVQREPFHALIDLWYSWATQRHQAGA